MSKHVPEGVPSRAEQLEKLRNHLLGNQVFGRLRGVFCQAQPHGVLLELAEAAESPTHFCQLWDQRAGDLRVVGNLLTQFQRDGWQEAKQELLNALISRGYLLPGETVPLETTTPLTILMPDPEKTFLWIEWVITGHWMDLDHYLDGEMPPGDLVSKLFVAFPSLKRYSSERRRRNDYEGWDLTQAFSNDVVSQFPLLQEKRGLELGRDTYNDHLEIGDHFGGSESRKLAFIFRGEQSEVLAQFSRHQQEKIATWQINFPLALLQDPERDLPRFRVGFHPEEEHPLWAKEHPAFISRGVSHGFGVTCAHQELTCEALGGQGYDHSWQTEAFRFFMD